MSQQSSDQAAYRAGHSTEKPLVDSNTDDGIVNEWCSELFDTVEHDVLWEVLMDQGLLKVCVKQGRATWCSEGVDAEE